MLVLVQGLQSASIVIVVVDESEEGRPDRAPHLAVVAISTPVDMILLYESVRASAVAGAMQLAV